MKNLSKKKAIPRIAGIIALVAILGFVMFACDNGTTPSTGGSGTTPGGTTPGGTTPGGTTPGGTTPGGTPGGGGISFPIILGDPESNEENLPYQKGWIIDTDDWDAFLEAKYLVIETKGEGDNAWGFGTLTFVLNGDGTDWDWDAGKTESADWNAISDGSGQWGSKGEDDTFYIVVELSKLKGYDEIIEGTQVQIFIQYPDDEEEDLIECLGFVNAYLTDETLTSSGDDLEDDSGNVIGFITIEDIGTEIGL